MRLLAKCMLIFLFPVFWAEEGAAFQSSTLFGPETPLEMELVTSLNELRLSKSDTVFFATYLRYKTEAEDWDSVRVELRARGNSRRTKCNFPPIRIKIRKKDSKNTIFEEDKALKLVLPCQVANSFNDMIRKEYICYKFYETITPYHFRTRLVNLTLTDSKERKSKTHNLTAFLIEDDDKAAKRFDGKISDAKMVRPNFINDTSALKQDFFAFMIGNTDWSNTVQHNVKIMEKIGSKHIPFPYDFDMAGIVGAPYAIPYDYLPITTVQERLYRGICRDPALVQYVRNLFIIKEQEFYDIMARYENDISTNDYKVARNYLSGFFEIIKNDKLFNSQILSKCQPDTY